MTLFLLCPSTHIQSKVHNTSNQQLVARPGRLLQLNIPNSITNSTNIPVKASGFSSQPISSTIRLDHHYH